MIPIFGIEWPVIIGIAVVLAFAWLTMRRAKFILLMTSVAYADNQTFRKSSERVNVLS